MLDRAETVADFRGASAIVTDDGTPITLAEGQIGSAYLEETDFDFATRAGDVIVSVKLTEATPAIPFLVRD